MVDVEFEDRSENPDYKVDPVVIQKIVAKLFETSTSPMNAIVTCTATIHSICLAMGWDMVNILKELTTAYEAVEEARKNRD